MSATGESTHPQPNWVRGGHTGWGTTCDVNQADLVPGVAVVQIGWHQIWLTQSIRS